jgi:hypothetical protein
MRINNNQPTSVPNQVPTQPAADDNATSTASVSNQSSVSADGFDAGTKAPVDLNPAPVETPASSSQSGQGSGLSDLFGKLQSLISNLESQGVQHRDWTTSTSAHKDFSWQKVSSGDQAPSALPKIDVEKQIDAGISGAPKFNLPTVSQVQGTFGNSSGVQGQAGASAKVTAQSGDASGVAKADANAGGSVDANSKGAAAQGTASVSAQAGAQSGSASAGAKANASVSGSVGANAKGVVAQGQAQTNTSANSQMGSASGAATWNASTSAGTHTDASGSTKLDAQGLHLTGQASAQAGVAAQASAQVQGKYGNASASASADAGAYANANGSADVNLKGATLKGDAQAGVEAKAEIDANFQSKGVDFGGQKLDLHGSGTADVEASADASADVNLTATIKPPRVEADVGGKAFAGVKAGVEGKIGVGNFITVQGQADAWAGAGAEAQGSIGYSDGKLHFSLDVGAALGAGAGASGDVTIDVKGLTDAAVNEGKAIATRGLQDLTNPQQAAQDFLTVKNDAENAVADVGAAAKSVETAVSNDVQKAKSAVLHVLSWV